MLNSQAQKTLYGLMDMIYPVGSYYITESSELNTAAKMAIKFGGTWVKVSNKFLYGTSSDSGAGTEGGSNDAKVISHSHTFTGTQGTTSSDGSHDHFLTSYNNAGSKWLSNNSTAHHNNWGVGTDDQSVTASSSYRTGSGGSHTHTFTPSGTISTEGSSGTNANMPAYRTVYIYRRTALAEGG